MSILANLIVQLVALKIVRIRFLIRFAMEFKRSLSFAFQAYTMPAPFCM